MGKANNKDRGLYQQSCYGAKMWYIRCSVNRQMKRFGPFQTKTLARQFYIKIKSTFLCSMEMKPTVTIEATPEILKTFTAQSDNTAQPIEPLR